MSLSSPQTTPSPFHINSLPTDVLRAIFEAGKKEGVHEEEPLFGHLVAQVCALWRSVAVSTPKLWHSLEAKSGRDISLFLTRLHRSGAIPLDIYIRRASSLFNSSVYPEIRANIYRLRRLEIYFEVPGQMIDVFRYLDVSAPLLVELNLSAPASLVGIDSWDLPAITSNLFAGHTPRLRSLTFPCYRNLPAGTEQAVSPTIPKSFFDGLSQLTLIAPSGALSSNIWSYSTNLVKLRIEDPSYSEADMLASPWYSGALDPISLSQLRSLSLRSSSLLFAGDFILRLRCLSLHYLSIDQSIPFGPLLLDDSGAGHLRDFMSFLVGSNVFTFKHLLTLRLNISMSVEGCAELLIHTPSLEQLSLLGAQQAPWTDALECSHRNEWLCPRVTKLVFTGCTAVSYGSISRMLRMREQRSVSGHTSRIDTVVLQCCLLDWEGDMHPFPLDSDCELGGVLHLVGNNWDVQEDEDPGLRDKRQETARMMWYMDY